MKVLIAFMSGMSEEQIQELNKLVIIIWPDVSHMPVAVAFWQMILGLL